MRLKGTKQRGGAREGAGRPKTSKAFSESMKKDVLRALRKEAKESGVSFGEHLVHLYKNANMATVQLGAGRLISEILVIKESHKTVEKTQVPVIGLPPKKEIEHGMQGRKQEEGRQEREIVH